MTVFAFCALAGRNAGVVRRLLDSLVHDGAELLPIRRLEPAAEAWTSPSGQLAMVTWSRPTTVDSSMIVRSDGLCATAVGGTAVAERIADRFAGVHTSDGHRRVCETIADEPGSWSYAHVDGRTDALVAATTITAVDPLYWSVGDGIVAIGNRALPVHRATTTGCFPEYDLATIATFVHAGYFLEGTPFRGVHRLPGSHVIEVVDGSLRLHRLDRPPLGGDSGSADQHHFDRVADAFANAFEPVKLSGSVQTGLTGGKDSRMILAGIQAAGIDIVAHTHSYGDANTSDVHVATLVAAAAGVEHTITRPPPAATSTQGTVDLRRRTRDAVFLAEGMISTYENVGFLPTQFADRPTLGGHGGELLRAGIALTVRQPHSEHYRSFVASSAQGNTDLLTDSARAHVDGVVDRWLAGYAHCSPTEILTAYHLDFKVGRWSGAARTAYLASRNQVQPLFDNRLVRLALAVPVQQRLEDRVVHEILSRLAPALVEIPFANDFWRWQSRADRTRLVADHPEAYIPRRPRPGQVNLDWRLTYATQLRSEIASILLDAPNSLLFEIVDRARLEALLAGPEFADSRFKNTTFNLCTLAILFNEDWIADAGTPGREIVVDADDVPR